MEQSRESENEFEREQEAAAAAEAAGIGGRVTSDDPTELELDTDVADRAVLEGGGGESEGFELAEAELEEHAAHGDSHSAGRILEDADLLSDGDGEAERGAEAGEADSEAPADA